MRTPAAARKAVRWTPEDAAKVEARLAAHKEPRTGDTLQVPSFLRACQDAAAAQKKRPKYAAQPVVLDGIRFDSRLECARYVQLMQLRAAGQVDWFTRQVPFYLPGGGKIVVDFLVRWADG